MLVLAHTKELIDQAADKLRKSNPDLNVEIEQAERRVGNSADIVVASVATIGKKNSKRLSNLNPEEFGVIVCDEAHHATAGSYINIFNHFGLINNQNEKLNDPSSRLLVGFTATPERGDKVGLSVVFDKVVKESTLREMIEQGYLCPIRAYWIPTGCDISDVKYDSKDFVISQLASVINRLDRNQLAVHCYRDLAYGKRGIVFCCDVSHAKAMAEEFVKGGIPAEAMWGDMGSDAREAALARFRSGETLILANCQILIEGFDEPLTEVAIMAVPTRSSGRYSQSIGRVTRPWPPPEMEFSHTGYFKESAIIIDLADTTKQGLPSAATLFGLPPKWNPKGRNLIEETEEFDRIVQECPKAAKLATTIDDARRLMKEIDIFSLREDDETETTKPFTKFNWTSLPDGSYAIGLLNRKEFESDVEVIIKNRSLMIRPDAIGMYRLVKREGNRLFPLLDKNNQPVVADMEEAFRMAERWIEIREPMNVSVLLKNAVWRDKDPSPGQVDLLKKFRRWRPGLTKGQAADLITDLLSKRKRPGRKDIK